MLNVYKVMSENITAAITHNGEQITKQPLIKSMRVVKKETLKLISHWVERSNDPQVLLVSRANVYPRFILLTSHPSNPVREV